MTKAIDDIAGRLIEAAFERFGRPPEAGGEYILTVTQDTEVLAYFREMAELAAAPWSRKLREHYRTRLDPDAAMVMDAGLDHLLSDGQVVAEQRRVIEEIKAFEAWIIEEEHKELRALEDAIWEEMKDRKGD